MSVVAGLLVLSGRALAALMEFDDYVDAVAEAFRLHAAGRSTSPAPLEIPAERGAFHVKAGGLPLERALVAVKVNGNFPGNPGLHGLPTIQGAVLLCDAENGTPLALLDSAEITLQRTGAATAVAARLLARPDSAVATICGCGAQGRIQLVALRHVLPLRRAFAWDRDPDVAAAYARRMSAELGIEIEPVATLRPATLASDVVAACTTSATPYLDAAEIRPGTFVAAIGADNPAKNELAPALMARGKVVADVLSQCAVMGDLHHAIAAGAMVESDAHGELGELLLGRKPGRTDRDEITIFDGTGVGILDVAAAARAWRLARERGIGSVVDFA